MKKVLWDKYEESLLFYTYLLVENNSLNKEEACSWLSGVLRNKVLRDDEEIEDTFRNYNGMSLRLASVQYVLSDGSKGVGHTSALDREYAYILKNNPKQFFDTLDEAGSIYRLYFSKSKDFVRTELDNKVIDIYPVAYRRIFTFMSSEIKWLNIEEICNGINFVLREHNVKYILDNVSWVIKLDNMYIFTDMVLGKNIHEKLKLDVKALLNGANSTKSTIIDNDSNEEKNKDNSNDEKKHINESTEIDEYYSSLNEDTKCKINQSEDKIADWFWREEDSSFVEYCIERDIVYMRDLAKVNFNGLIIRKTLTTKNNIVNRFHLWLDNFKEEKSIDDEILSNFLK